MKKMQKELKVNVIVHKPEHTDEKQFEELCRSYAELVTKYYPEEQWEEYGVKKLTADAYHSSTVRGKQRNHK